MKSYLVALKRTSYVYVNVDTDNPNEVEMLAWLAIQSGSKWDEENAQWELESIEKKVEMK